MDSTSVGQKLSSNVLRNLRCVIETEHDVGFQLIANHFEFEWSAGICGVAHLSSRSEHSVVKPIRVCNEVDSKETDVIIERVECKVFVNHWITRIAKELPDEGNG